jgi:hypothetical protein
MIGSIKNFLFNQAGHATLIFGLTIIPVTCAVGLSVDYSQLSMERTRLQNEADADALAHRNGVWLNSTTYQVTRSQQSSTYFLGVLGYKNVDISVLSQSYADDSPPGLMDFTFHSMDGSAHDYNQLSVYCLNTSNGSYSDVRIIADNRGTAYDKWAPCPAGTEMNYALFNDNIEYARKNYGYGRCPLMYAPLDCRIELYIKKPASDTNWYFTQEPYTSVYYIDSTPFLETVLCDSLTECLVENPCNRLPGQKLDCLNYADLGKGGKIPRGTNRTPLNETRTCAPGKYMYYGWEDRSQPRGSDRDFNDMAYIVACPGTTPGSKKGIVLRK